MSNVRILFWTLTSRVRARHVVHASGLTDLTLDPAPPLGLHNVGKVERVLAITRATCLVRSAVVQRWLADNGQNVDLIVGVTAPSRGFKAHAWLDREAERHNSETFTEIARIRAPRRVQ